jgi:hypothetical protein
MLALALVACESEDAPPAQLGEVCGVEGAFSLAPLDPGDFTYLTAVADRVVYPVYKPGAVEGEYEYQADLWSIGPCGEEPRLLTGDFLEALHLERWPDTLLVCSVQSPDIVSIDPTGALPPHVVFPGVGCRAPQTAYGLLPYIVGDSLTLYPYPDDPRTQTSEPVVLLDELPDYTEVEALDEMAFLLTRDGTLSRVDLPDGAVTVEQSGVRRFSVSKDGRYLLTQKREQAGDDGLPYEEPIVLTDRSTGQGTLLTMTDLNRNFGREFAAIDQGIVTLKLDTQVIRLYFLPGLDSADLPFGLVLKAPLADGRWLLTSLLDHSLHLGDPRDPGSITPIFAEAQIVAVEPDGVRVLNINPETLEGDLADESPLWFVPFDGSQARRLANRMTRDPRLLADGRYITLLDIDEQRRGDLTLVDPETLDERLVDRQVANYGVLELLGDDIVWYLVADGERAGLWLARLQPTD